MPEPDVVVASLANVFASRPPSGVQSASIVADHLRQEPLRATLERLLEAGHSRTSVAAELAKSYGRSIPTIRAALDVVFPRNGRPKSSARPKVSSPRPRPKVSELPVGLPPAQSSVPHPISDASAAITKQNVARDLFRKVAP
jgi:hypothetical protein